MTQNLVSLDFVGGPAEHGQWITTNLKRQITSPSKSVPTDSSRPAVVNPYTDLLARNVARCPLDFTNITQCSQAVRLVRASLGQPNFKPNLYPPMPRLECIHVDTHIHPQGSID